MQKFIVLNQGEGTWADTIIKCPTTHPPINFFRRLNMQKFIVLNQGKTLYSHYLRHKNFQLIFFVIIIDQCYFGENNIVKLQVIYWSHMGPTQVSLKARFSKGKNSKFWIWILFSTSWKSLKVAQEAWKHKSMKGCVCVWCCVWCCGWWCMWW